LPCVLTRLIYVRPTLRSRRSGSGWWARSPCPEAISCQNGLRRPRGNANSCFICQELCQCRRVVVPTSPAATSPRIRRADPDPRLGSERRSQLIPAGVPSIGSKAQDCPERRPTASSWLTEHRPRWRCDYDSTHRLEQSRPVFGIPVRSRYARADPPIGFHLARSPLNFFEDSGCGTRNELVCFGGLHVSADPVHRLGQLVCRMPRHVLPECVAK